MCRWNCHQYGCWWGSGNSKESWRKQQYCHARNANASKFSTFHAIFHQMSLSISGSHDIYLTLNQLKFIHIYNRDKLGSRKLVLYIIRWNTFIGLIDSNVKILQILDILWRSLLAVTWRKQRIWLLALVNGWRLECISLF